MPRLACDISQSLWDAINEVASENGETIGHLVSRSLADTLQLEHGTLFQVSTSGALVEGVLDGVVSVETLREHGNFGLGTYADLDGEMIALDGVFYRVRSDGSVHVEEGSSLSPFALVTHFNPEENNHAPAFCNDRSALCAVGRTAWERQSLLRCASMWDVFASTQPGCLQGWERWNARPSCIPTGRVPLQ